MKITCLGTGTPEPYVARASSGYLVEIGADRILFDCGGGVFDRLLQAGRMPQDITHLFFSHLHTDHMMDYARLVHAAWDEGGAPLPVFGPAPIAEITEKLFSPDGVLATDLRARTGLKPSQEVWKARGGTLPRPWPAPIVTEITPGFAFEGDGWRLTSCSVPHAQPLLECMAFAIEAGGKKFVYSGDAGICEPLAAMCGNAALLVHWCYRFGGDSADPEMARLAPTPGEIAAMAEQARVKHLVLTHIRRHLDTPEAKDQALADMRAIFSGTAEIAEDLREFTL
ncbi:MAG: MBL fold metallo-hydrolase [Pseudomonadota bacterium]